MAGPGEQGERERLLTELILRGMAADELPTVLCPRCGRQVEYVSVFREAGRVVSLTTACPCGYVNGAIRGI